ncbi:FUSC family protein [Arhodomonas aquaeolei]|uniref:FUSC family protein n=1 Tax=Arhodomonas aquaeolei TaxID=2369 RepID=UPI002168CF52|nr:FUSC family protein [Arhodomonas aquaeolei]MCS4504874.1 FUSC family protein [Arhodomonas aquaeolei]
MPVLLEAYLTPSRQALRFALKATLAMLLALYAALWFDLERPYWALIAAAFLQIRPMSGMVIEKGLCQIGGTLIGAVAGIAVMALSAQAAAPALYALTLWVMACAYAGSLMRGNFTYGCVMAAITALLVVFLSLSQPDRVFDVAVARVSELGLGEISATLVSALVWPVRVTDHLAEQADAAINSAFTHAGQRLDADMPLATVQRSLTASLGPLNVLEADSQAARYEGPGGGARIRAAHVLTQRAMRLFAALGGIQQLLRDHPGRIGAPLCMFAGEMAEGFREAESVRGVPAARRHLQALRERARTYPDDDLDPLQRRVVTGLRAILGHAMVLLDAREAIAHPGRHQLRSGVPAWHRDHGEAAVNALRAGAAFAASAAFWVATHWSGGPIAVLMATLPSVLFANRDNPATICTMFFKGMLAALPSAFLFGHVLLARASGFPMLAMLVLTPLFIGLLGAGHRRLVGYCLPFTIFNILLTMPGNGMDLSFDNFANRALAVTGGLAVATVGFRLVPGLGASLRRRRLIHAIGVDLHRLAQPPLHEVEARFSGRMADRLLRLARHDDLLDEAHRHLLMIGLNGLDVGIAGLRLRHRLDGEPPPVRAALVALLDTLAAAFVASARGHAPVDVAAAARTLDAALVDHDVLDERGRAPLRGLLERLELALARQASEMGHHRRDAPVAVSA